MPAAADRARLGSHHDLTTFQSGNAGLDGWLRRHALAAQEMDSTRNFLLTDGERIVGYLSLKMGSVLRADGPAKLVRGLPAYPGGNGPLARLAVDNREQGKGLGALMLAEVLHKASSDEGAARFYARHGLVPVPQQPLRLYRHMKDVRASLDAADS